MKQFDLEKETLAAKRFILEKFEVPDIRAAMGVNLDLSGSTEDLYHSGAFQKAFQRILPIALNFDDNGEVDVWTFNDGNSYNQLAAANRSNYADYIDRQVLRNSAVAKWGGTDYAPVMRANLTHYGYLGQQMPKATGWKRFLPGGGGGQTALADNANNQYPTLVYHLTDGANSQGDREPVRQLLRDCESAGIPIYYHMVGIGRAHFGFIEEIADEFGNVGFVNVTNINQLSEGADEVYELLLPEEMRGWFKNHFNR